MKLLRLSALFILVVAASPASAQPAVNMPSQPTQRSAESIAAVVNGDVISERDVDQRTKLVLLSSNLPDTPDMRSRVVGQQLRRLIDEDLKNQAATKENITVSPGEIAAEMDDIEQRNHMAPGGLVKLLASKGIETETLRQQIRAEITWSKLVHQTLVRKVHVGENAVTARLDAIRANLGKPEYRVAEIYLAVDGDKSEAEVRDLAERLTEQMRTGAPFAAIARQFSETGAADGNLGWVSEGMLDDELLTALDRLQPNMVTPPIRTADGYHILMLLEKRKVGEGLDNGPTVDLMTIDLNSLPGAKQAERDLQMRRLHEILAPAKSCDDLARLGEQVPSATINIMQKLPEAQIPTKVALLIKDLPPGRFSEPIDAPKGRRFFAVCGRASGHSDELPSADFIRHLMENEQLELVARRYSLDLHRGVVIDIRQ